MTTQNCAECGTRAEPGQTFCDACGAVLGWTDRAPARAGAGSGSGTAPGAAATTGAGPGPAAGGSGGAGAGRPSGEPAHEPVPPRPTTDAPATDASRAPDAARPAEPAASPAAADASAAPAGSDDEDTAENPLPPVPPQDGTTAAADGGPAPAPTPGTTSGTTTGAATPPAVPAPAPDATAPTRPVPAAPALGDTMAARARSLLVPVADAEPRPAAPPSVAPVLPGRPVADRPQVRAPGPVQGDQHGVACPWCATPNNPDRHFCVRCAMPMTLEDRSSVRLPWWRRLFDRNGQTPWAGDRPRLRRTFDRIVTWVTAAVVLTLLIVAGMNTPAAVQATRDHFSKRAPVPPDSVAASRSYPGHKPELAFDKINNSWWGPGVAQSGAGEWIEARFAEPTRLLDVIITSGTSTRADQLSESALPHRIKATITLKDGTTATRELTLDQSAGGQRRAFRVGEVTKVRFTIESSYAVSGSKQVSIAEIEFFGRSSANTS
ncbi:zinc ribbon domain-containing protein [Streptomyces sp. NBC_00704]|uniref:NADase-type glycan-binding domain-containing protein n=1 Tax=Streptomyces sp. NBC_00704 TaxID=2975809 RepID=UPI002E36734D|nr:zinc ribbon domain-containing protein [Streptomyces sp. NBC_00704]